MIGENEEQARAAANFISSRDNSAKIEAQMDHEEFIRQNEEVSAQLLEEFEAAPFVGYLQEKAEELGLGVVESWKYAHKSSAPEMGIRDARLPSTPRTIQLGASIEHLSWMSDDAGLPVRAMRGAILRYRELQGELLPERGAWERVFARYGIPYRYPDTEEYKERGLFAVAHRSLDLSEPPMISFGELDEAPWRSEGDKLAVINYLSVGADELSEQLDGTILREMHRASADDQQRAYIRNLFDKQTLKRWYWKQARTTAQGLFRLRERAFTPDLSLADMDELARLTETFISRYHNPLYTDEEFRNQVLQESQVVQERVKIGDKTSVFAYESLSRALQRDEETLETSGVVDPFAGINTYPAEWKVS